jgi:preprotein translocase subunit SecA
VPCGLHIVGTERHEARRIDNQLRGRSGRQGDPGGSRFFLSLRDDLMSIFAGEWTLKVLGWLGLQGDVAIEDRRVSKGIERAQKKVEERNFETRKNLLEYDEVMDYQRRAFYSQRQKVLEGRDLEGLVMAMVLASVDDCVESYLGGGYSKRCIAEWARQNLLVQIAEGQVRAEAVEDLPDLEDQLRQRAKEEARSVISMTLGEYMDEEMPPEEWDLRGLSAWAMSRFSVNLSQNQLRKMSPQEVEAALSSAAEERIDRIDLSPVAVFLESGFSQKAMAEWASSKFNVEVKPEELTGEPAHAREALRRTVHEAYLRREVEYPVEYAMDMTIGMAGPDSVYALNNLASWANRKFGLSLTADGLRDRKVEAIRSDLIAESRRWLTGGALEETVRQALGNRPAQDEAIEFARTRFDTELKRDDFNGDVIGKVVQAGRKFLRREMTELERFVLLQIYDSSWKDHLLAMDHLKSGIGLRGFAEQDPRVAYKREGSRLFQEMLTGVRDKVTDMIFKVRLGAGQEMTSVYQISNVVHEQLSGYDHLAQDMADQAAAAKPQKVATIVRDVPRVGRNDLCPCGSGKKYKKCCGRTK